MKRREVRAATRQATHFDDLVGNEHEHGLLTRFGLSDPNQREAVTKLARALAQANERARR